MTPRFRMIAGPNGSGKTTLAARLHGNYAVNFYLMLNADDIFAEVRRSGVYGAPFPIEGAELADHAMKSSYPESVKMHSKISRRRCRIFPAPFSSTTPDRKCSTSHRSQKVKA